MYSESDIDGAVTAGALSPEAARGLRNHIARTRAAPAVDEESFRLLTGFNDVFVSIAIVLLLAALLQIGTSIDVARWLGGAAVAGAAWLLAGYFTARRRMALPSILLLLAFVGGVAAALAGLIEAIEPDLSERGGALAAAGVALVAAGAAWAHWRRFAVPITVAAGAVAAVGVVAGLVTAAVPDAVAAIWQLLFVAGLGVFAVAMRWDLSDRERRTRRADVAFWLHLAAAPMIAHPIFKLLGIFDREVTVAVALVVLSLYFLFAVIALAIDRRALLVSGLGYVLYAMIALFRTAGAVELSWALTAFVIGSALLTLSAFWHPTRARVVSMLGDLGRRLPPTATPAAA
ncbi:hypothetical protein [uncultured Sphingomonas sp.]|uniref:hypothetical protein n=1 Tax=uncultured Sphingomonas sp. TaxID=158754 RepID=UPI0035CBCAE0